MKKYDSYKDSGIEWIGVIPEHWAESKIKYLSKEPSSLFIDGDWIESKVIVEQGIRYITTGNIKVGYYSEQGSGFISEETFAELKCTEVFEGDLVISRLNNPIGRACIIPNLNNRIVTSVDNVIFRPDSNVNKFYLLYLFCSKEYFEITDLISRGATMQRISRGLYGNIKIPLPPIKEQNAIASYLDKKTTQIDHLIAKKEQFIQLLEEERVAVINQVVTKGLDPNVTMKDSGIEWLGQIPEHWKVKSFRFCIDILTDYTANGSFASLAQNVTYFDSGYSRLVRLTDLRVNLENEGLFVDEGAHNFLKKSELFGGELLIANVGAYAGLVLQMPLKEGKFTLGPNMFLLRLNQNTDFFINQLNSSFCAEQLKMMAVSSAQPKLNKENIRQLKVVTPPVEEQDIITIFIKKESDRIETLISKSKEEIELLKEYKTSLISEVVTGKVDVRNEKLN